MFMLFHYLALENYHSVCFVVGVGPPPFFQGNLAEALCLANSYGRANSRRGKGQKAKKKKATKNTERGAIERGEKKLIRLPGN